MCKKCALHGTCKSLNALCNKQSSHYLKKGLMSKFQEYRTAPGVICHNLVLGNVVLTQGSEGLRYHLQGYYMPVL